jgi:phospholipid/cholesterol/gamma-HCH transport system substrate-binding protein
VSPRVSYALVGVFVLVLGAALTGGLLWLWSGGPGDDQKSYLVEVKGSVAGLAEDGPVLFQGVEVGQVDRIRLDPNDPGTVRVLLSVRADTPVKEDTYAELRVRGLTGMVDVNLLGSSRESPRLEREPGRTYAVIPSRPSLLPKLEESIPRIVDNVEAIAKKLDQVLGENQETVRRTMANVEALSDSLLETADTAGQALHSFATTMKRFEGTAEDVTAALKDIRGGASELPGLMRDARRAVRDLRGALDEAQAALATYRAIGERVERAVQVIGGDLERFAGEGLPQLHALLVEVRQSVSAVGRLARQLARNPDSLLFGAAEPPKGPGE